jgi:hypothetical protein
MVILMENIHANYTGSFPSTGGFKGTVSVEGGNLDNLI